MSGSGPSRAPAAEDLVVLAYVTDGSTSGRRCCLALTTEGRETTDAIAASVRPTTHRTHTKERADLLAALRVLVSNRAEHRVPASAAPSEHRSGRLAEGAIGPNDLTWSELAVATLADTGLRGRERLDVVATLAGHARAIAQQTAADVTPEKTLTRAMVTIVAENAERFPAMANALKDDDGVDDAYAFGLARILDGVELLVTTRCG